MANFVNLKNEADQRVLALVSEKFKLFEGVFGASDEVLGAIENGVDIEIRIADIYQTCRTPDEIKTAFDLLQEDLRVEIDSEMNRTHRELLANFDDSVLERVRITATEYRSRYERQLMTVARQELNGCADFISDVAFRLNSSPFAGDIPLGRYELPGQSGEAHILHANAPLVLAMVERAKGRVLPVANLCFRYNSRAGKISAIEPYIGESGQLTLTRFTVNALDDCEEHLIFAVITDSGKSMKQEAAESLFSLPADVTATISAKPDDRLEHCTQSRKREILRLIQERHSLIVKAEEKKLEDWADDLKLGIQREINKINQLVKKARSDASATLTMETRIPALQRLKKVKDRRKKKHDAILKAQGEIDRKREQLVESIKGKVEPKTSSELLFSARWSVHSSPP